MNKLILVLVLLSSNVYALDGKQLYTQRCTMCHNEHATQQGSIGPDVWGSSRPLLEARVLRASYPEGYKPKRTSFMMPRFDDLNQADVDALHTWLNSADSK